MTQSEEKHLIEATQQGDRDAFNPLVRKYHRNIYTHIHRRVKDVEVAKDLSQEVWLRAYRGIGGFRRESGFSSWVYRIAENVCIDYFRKQHDTDTEPLHLIDPSRLLSTAACPSRDLLRAELRQNLRAAIAELPPMRRRVFLFYYHHELPIKTIAHRLNRSSGTIKTHLRNARRDLRELLITVFES